MVTKMMIRPMTPDDVPAVEQITATAFYDLDVRTRPAGWPPPERRSPARAELWQVRLRHLISHDQPGCWVAESADGPVVGAVAALLREGLWGLATYAVAPGLQAKGVGRELLQAALTYGPPDAPGFICSSHDVRAIRRYRLAGFDIHPTMLMWGRVDRAALPSGIEIREGGLDDLELLDDIDQASRGHGHGVDHTIMVNQFRLLVSEKASSRSYTYLSPSGAPYLLAGTDEAAAERVLWAALAATDPDVPIDFGYLTARHGWAVDSGLRAGLELHNRGYLALRGMAPPAAYLPSAHFL
jgi:GNAT superfamily N-acetyltransferase